MVRRVNGHKEIAELLIAKGADVNAKDDDDKTPLEAAEDYPETADIIRKHGGKTGVELSIHKAAEAGNIEAVKQHLAAGADVNAKDELGGTPLHHTVVAGHKKIVELLIAEGADVNAKNKRGKTPLDWAEDYPETADIIRKHGGQDGCRTLNSQSCRSRKHRSRQTALGCWRECKREG